MGNGRHIGMAPRIRSMLATGYYSNSAIAKAVGCSRPNVSRLAAKLKIKQGWAHTIAPIGEANIAWLVDEAKRVGIKPAEMARSMLIDAIADAREEGK